MGPVVVLVIVAVVLAVDVLALALCRAAAVGDEMSRRAREREVGPVGRDRLP